MPIPRGGSPRGRERVASSEADAQVAGPLRLALPGGRRFTASDAVDALRQLNARSVTPQPDIWRFMTRWAARLQRATGTRIRCGSPAAFLEDLARLGWLELDGDPFDQPSAT